MPRAAPPSAGSTAAPGGPTECDALVIGAGPVGLFQVFQLGLQGIACQVVDALPEPGGQCMALYADKPIYDIPAVQVCTGRELVGRLMQQIAPFAPGLHLGQTVDALSTREDGRFALHTSAGRHFIARTVFIAAGVGAFLPRQLALDGADALRGLQLHDRMPAPEILAGRQVLVVGGEDDAVAAAVVLAEARALHTTNPAAHPADNPAPARITLLHRRTTLSAEPALLARLQAMLQAGHLQFQVGQLLALQAEGGRLHTAQLIDEDSITHTLPVDQVLAFLGLSPKLGPVAQWGLALARRQLVVDAAHFETSTPGIFAVGDVISYPGKKKLILCGFHEATLAAFAATARLRPGQPVLLQYTTTSPQLHQRLGVATPARP